MIDISDKDFDISARRKRHLNLLGETTPVAGSPGVGVWDDSLTWTDTEVWSDNTGPQTP